MSDFALCPNAPNGPRDCGMVAVQVDADGQRWVCTACYAKGVTHGLQDSGSKGEKSEGKRKKGKRDKR